MPIQPLILHRTWSPKCFPAPVKIWFRESLEGTWGLEPTGGYCVMSIPEVTCVSGYICKVLGVQTDVHFQLAE